MTLRMQLHLECHAVAFGVSLLQSRIYYVKRSISSNDTPNATSNDTPNATAFGVSSFNLERFEIEAMTLQMQLRQTIQKGGEDP